MNLLRKLSVLCLFSAFSLFGLEYQSPVSYKGLRPFIEARINGKISEDRSPVLAPFGNLSLIAGICSKVSSNSYLKLYGFTKLNEFNDEILETIKQKYESYRDNRDFHSVENLLTYGLGLQTKVKQLEGQVEIVSTNGLDSSLSEGFVATGSVAVTLPKFAKQPMDIAVGIDGKIFNN